MIPTITHWIGQEQAIRRFQIALEASWNDATKLPHMLFTGGPGLGKTMLAQLAAKELGVQLHERVAQVVNTMGSLNGLLLQANDKDIVFLDEIHELLPLMQVLLYRAVEGRQISIRTCDDKTLTIQHKTCLQQDEPVPNDDLIGAGRYENAGEEERAINGNKQTEQSRDDDHDRPSDESFQEPGEH